MVQAPGQSVEKIKYLWQEVTNKLVRSAHFTLT
jgi:hypothetical protein